ncbi:hypothetical protein PUNSTDRAFT_146892 [Punctularia strigosozonata HHB-11173 SS5]|uniref:CS domain-containing protein n=1 Tax=Punctularia strigosozonata (strain HHB-11173) TaxID=741275 RepID=R7S1T8_PUNST|nr:uncharacterized protein PUNSTDRAFT_146892 [Punctularia strigosozonata HHB-11173 SS5]EIN03722.1 hypothetical protein PUNSTDRAFT_146892 [Punctularia strigosozonata HHB-11173 SS5]
MDRPPLPPYSWHQSHDQATVLLHVPYDTADEDVDVVIERDNLVAGVRGQPPVIKGKLYGNVDVSRSVWQLESRTSRHLARERTISSVSTTSTQSSFAYVSDVDISSSFAASLESTQASDSEDPTPLSSRFPSGEEIASLRTLRRQDTQPLSRSMSPHDATMFSIPSSFSSSLESLPSPSSRRLLTLHLEKADPSGFWPSLVTGPVPLSLSPSPDGDEEYNMDSTSLTLLAAELQDIRKDKEGAFEMFVRAWRRDRTPSAALRLAPYFASVGLPPPKPSSTRGSPGYHLARLGGPTALAHLLLQVGLLHLEGAAPDLSASHSGLSSLRIPTPSSSYSAPGNGQETWRRDRELAARYFDRARALCPELDVPVIQHEPHASTPSGSELLMPSIELPPPVRSETARKRKVEQASNVSVVSKATASPATEDIDSTWYLYIPGLVGAGFAVAVVGMLSFSSWSKSRQAS